MVDALGPLARLSLQCGYGVEDMCLAAKIACIDIASENARIAGRLNKSRIAAATGLTRKEVSVLLNSRARVEKGALEHGLEISGQRVGRVVEGWVSDPAFLTDNGRPAALQVTGTGVSFATLVRRFGGDVTPVAVLKELQRLGLATRTKTGQVRLVRSGRSTIERPHRAMEDFAARVRLLGNQDHGAKSTDGLDSFEASFQLGPQETALFRALFSKRGSDLVESAHRWTNSNTRDQKGKGAGNPQERKQVEIRVSIAVRTL